MSYAKPIWNEVQACNYQSSKSFGNKRHTKVVSYTGSSVSNSNELCTYEVEKKLYENFVVFNAYFDGKLMKQNINLRGKEDRAGDFIQTRKRKFVNQSNIDIILKKHIK